MDKEKLNKDIHYKLLKASEIFLKREDDKSISLIEALELTEEVKQENMNDVTEIYIYEEGFGNTEKKHKDTLVHLITSIIAFDYSDENMLYLKKIILDENNNKSDVALDYFLKIGAYHDKFKDEVLNFVEENINDLNKNKLNIIAFYMFKIYTKNTRTDKLFNLAKKLNNEKFPSNKNGQQTNTVYNAADFEKIMNQENKKQPWWKFW